MFYPSRFGEGLANSDIARQARIAAERQQREIAACRAFPISRREFPSYEEGGL